MRLRSTDLYRSQPTVARAMWDAGQRPRRVAANVQVWNLSRPAMIASDVRAAVRYFGSPLVVILMLLVLTTR